MSSLAARQNITARTIVVSRRDAQASRALRRAATVVVRAGVTDPATKVTFPDSADGLTCVGAGCRVKRVAIIDIKVYAMACYVDADGARANKSVGLAGGDYARMLSIQLARDVDGPTFYGALDEALNPRIKELATNLATAEDEDGNFMASVAEEAEKEEEKALDELDDMRRVFGGMNLKQGTKMTISWTPKESVKASIDVSGAEKLNFESDVLAKALLDTYFGSQPVSPAALQAFEKGFAAL